MAKEKAVGLANTTSTKRLHELTTVCARDASVPVEADRASEWEWASSVNKRRE